MQSCLSAFSREVDDIFGRSSGWDVSVDLSLVRLVAGRPARMETDAGTEARNNGGLSLGQGHGDGEKGNL